MTFNKRGYERRRFVYLTAIIAIALTNRVREDDRFADVVLHLRRRIQAEMQSRWDDTTDSSDKAIDEAAQDCARLLFTPPSEDRALSLTWPQEWMKECGADVTNPVTLFKMSYSWKQQYLVVAEFVRRVILRQD